MRLDRAVVGEADVGENQIQFSVRIGEVDYLMEMNVIAANAKSERAV